MKKTVQAVLKRVYSVALMVYMVLVAANAALAASGSGIAKVDSFLDKTETALHGVAIVVCTIAVMWAGYKFFFQHGSKEDCAKILGGGLLIGSAAEIAAFLVG